MHNSCARSSSKYLVLSMLTRFTTSQLAWLTWTTSIWGLAAGVPWWRANCSSGTHRIANVPDSCSLLPNVLYLCGLQIIHVLALTLSFSDHVDNNSWCSSRACQPTAGLTSLGGIMRQNLNRQFLLQDIRGFNSISLRSAFIVKKIYWRPPWCFSMRVG